MRNALRIDAPGIGLELGIADPSAMSVISRLMVRCAGGSLASFARLLPR
jgi:hypothetical protein